MNLGSDWAAAERWSLAFCSTGLTLGNRGGVLSCVDLQCESVARPKGIRETRVGVRPNKESRDAWYSGETINSVLWFVNGGDQLLSALDKVDLSSPDSDGVNPPDDSREVLTSFLVRLPKSPLSLSSDLG